MSAYVQMSLKILTLGSKVIYKKYLVYINMLMHLYTLTTYWLTNLPG